MTFTLLAIPVVLLTLLFISLCRASAQADRAHEEARAREFNP